MSNLLKMAIRKQFENGLHQETQLNLDLKTGLKKIDFVLTSM